MTPTVSPARAKQASPDTSLVRTQRPVPRLEGRGAVAVRTTPSGGGADDGGGSVLITALSPPPSPPSRPGSVSGGSGSGGSRSGGSGSGRSGSAGGRAQRPEGHGAGG